MTAAWCATASCQTVAPRAPRLMTRWLTPDAASSLAAADESAAANELAASGVSHLVIKRGARGATVWHDAVAHHAAVIPVTVLDTVGAGDAFTAGYLSGVLDGLSPAAALHRGTITGAFAVAAVGDWEGLPTRDELSLLDTDAGATLR